MMIRSYVKSAAAQAVSWTGLDAVAHAKLHGQIPFVAAYHRVVERLNADRPFALPAMEISVAMLERQLDWLASHFRIISLEDLAVRLQEPPGSKPLAAITFDDGYSDVFHHAYPLLKRKGIPAVIFVVTDLVGTATLPIHERLHATIVRAWPRWPSPLARPVPASVRDPFSATRFLLATMPLAEVERIINHLDPDHNADRVLTAALRPLDWEMLAIMKKSGVTIGSHSKTHAFLANESDPRIREEIEFSKRDLESRLGTRVDCFAYPGGSFHTDVVEAVASAGYRFAFTICRHRHRRYPMLTIPRTGLWQQSCLDPHGQFSQAIMSCHAAGTFRLMSSCGQRHRRVL